VRGGKPPEPKPAPPTPASTTIAAAVPALKPTRRFRFTAVGERLNEMFGLKIETPRHVTWRKHWVVLAEKIAEPLAAVLILVVVGLIHITGVIPIRIFGTASSSLEVTLAVIAVWFILFFAAAGWVWYQYEDWSNDIYRVTDDRIIDEERSPFGLRTHSIETTLDRVQDVSYVQQGLLANFFKFGDLVIETAGAGRIRFQGIVRPTAASQEIFRRRDAHRSRQQVEVARQERREFLDWFMEYHRFLIEQGAIKQAQPKGSFPEEPAAPADSTAAA
jgi:hypothetical protein